MTFLQSACAPTVRFGAILAAAFCFGACKPQQNGTPEDDAVRQGRSVYILHCTACHNSGDPGKDGTLGPAIKGSSLELLQARILRGEYPAGYTPKRATHIMPKLPLTDDDIRHLHAFLNAP